MDEWLVLGIETDQQYSIMVSIIEWKDGSEVTNSKKSKSNKNVCPKLSMNGDY